MIGIIGALQKEIDAIKKYMHMIEETTIYGIKFYQGTINNKKVVACLSGVGKVEASMATTVLISNFDIDMIINIGTAGGLVETQNTLDIVVSQKVIQHDFDTSYVDGEEGKGLVFESDQSLVEKVKKAFMQNELASNIYIGDIISGDQFIGEEQKLLQLLNDFPTAIACEMEAGAIAQVCTKAQIPFVVIRSLSDIVKHDNSHIEFMENVAITSARSAQMLVKFMEVE